jgi:hypothetical protein
VARFQIIFRWDGRERSRLLDGSEAKLDGQELIVGGTLWFEGREWLVVEDERDGSRSFPRFVCTPVPGDDEIVVAAQRLIAAALLEANDVLPSSPLANGLAEDALFAAYRDAFPSGTEVGDRAFQRARLAVLVAGRELRDGREGDALAATRVLEAALGRLAVPDTYARHERTALMARADGAVSSAWQRCLDAAALQSHAEQTCERVRQGRARRARLRRSLTATA